MICQVQDCKEQATDRWSVVLTTIQPSGMKVEAHIDLCVKHQNIHFGPKRHVKPIGEDSVASLEREEVEDRLQNLIDVNCGYEKATKGI